MVDRLRHLDLLLQLQGELFEDTLKEVVNNIFVSHSSNHVLSPGFDCFPITNGNYLTSEMASYRCWSHGGSIGNICLRKENWRDSDKGGYG